MDLVKHSDVKPSKVKGCKYCGKEFVKKHRNHLFCSKNCARENYKTHHSTYQPKNEIFNKTCQFCENKFETKIFNKIYCSDDCGKQYRQMKYMQSRKLKGFKPANRKCLNCGKEFVFDSRKQSGKKYCNDKCGYEYNPKNRRKRKNSADNLKEIVTNKVKKILEQAKNTEPNTA